MGNLEKYRKMLVEHGFDEATQNPFHFLRKLTDKTAFIINLKELPYGTGIVYGVISTALLGVRDGYCEYFNQHGQFDGSCNLRFYLEILTESDAVVAADTIGMLYQKYLYIDKDTLLTNVKELRKQFILQITNVLKPLGFRKKGNQWRRKLSDDIMLQFWADKDPYSDLYYFEVDIYSLIPPGGVWCCSKRLDTKGTDIFDWKNASEPHRRFDWQLQSTDDLLEIVNRAYEQELRPFLENDLFEMGKKSFVWNECICKRTRCENCWVEKNLWEAKG